MGRHKGPKHGGREERSGEGGSGDVDLSLDARQLKIENVAVEVAGAVKVEIKNLEAELTLDLDLDRITGLLERLLDVAEQNPESLRSIVGALESGIKNATGEGAGREAEATEAARKKAEELDVTIPSVEGSGSGGRVTVKDVEKAADNNGV